MFRHRSIATFGSLVAILLALSLAACSSQTQTVQPADTRAADADAIRAADVEWNKAMQAKDVDRSISFYGDGAILLGNKAPSVQDRDAIRKEFQEMLGHTTGNFSFTNTSVEVAKSGDLAWEHGVYEFNTTDKKGKPVVETGKYLTVWKKQSDGTWKAVADMDNTDQ
jgi:ketosteroid isomerase-like protein